MLTSPFTAGASITAASLASLAPLAAFKFADQNTGTSSGSTALVNDSDLALDLEADGVYSGIALIVYSASAPAGYKFGWTLPAGAVLAWDPYPYQGSGTQNALTASNTPTATATGTSSNLSFKIVWDVRMGAAAGTLQWQFAQGTSDASNCWTRAGSKLLGWQIA